MKRLILILGMIALALSSCGNNGESSMESADETYKVYCQNILGMHRAIIKLNTVTGQIQLIDIYSKTMHNDSIRIKSTDKRKCNRFCIHFDESEIQKDALMVLLLDKETGKLWYVDCFKDNLPLVPLDEIRQYFAL